MKSLYWYDLQVQFGSSLELFVLIDPMQVSQVRLLEHVKQPACGQGWQSNRSGIASSRWEGQWQICDVILDIELFNVPTQVKQVVELRHVEHCGGQAKIDINIVVIYLNYTYAIWRNIEVTEESIRAGAVGEYSWRGAGYTGDTRCCIFAGLALR